MWTVLASPCSSSASSTPRSAASRPSSGPTSFNLSSCLSPLEGISMPWIAQIWLEQIQSTCSVLTYLLLSIIFLTTQHAGGVSAVLQRNTQVGPQTPNFQPDWSSSLTHIIGWSSSAFEHFVGPSWASHCLGNNFRRWLPVDGSLCHQSDAGWWHLLNHERKKEKKYLCSLSLNRCKGIWLCQPWAKHGKPVSSVWLLPHFWWEFLKERKKLVLNFEWYFRLDWLDGWVWCCMQYTLIVILLPQKQWGSRLV